MSIYFTGDTHFGHANIIRYCKRPFSSADEMDETIIANLNAVVQPRDTLYHLGDFCFGRFDIVSRAQAYLDRIKCKNIILVIGNHDPHYEDGTPRREFAYLFSGCYNILRKKMTDEQLGLDRHLIVMCHYAMRVWDKSHFGSYNLFGHSHNTLADDPRLLSMDVGVDANNFKPINLAQIKAVMDTRTFVPIISNREREGIGA